MTRPASRLNTDPLPVVDEIRIGPRRRWWLLARWHPQHAVEHPPHVSDARQVRCIEVMRVCGIRVHRVDGTLAAFILERRVDRRWCQVWPLASCGGAGSSPSAPGVFHSGWPCSASPWHDAQCVR